MAAWSVDRLGRSMQHLVTFLDELRAKGVNLYLHQQGLDTSTPAGRALFQMCGVFAEFERAMIVERVRAGLRRAKAAGKRLGRPRIPCETERRILRELAKGRGPARRGQDLRGRCGHGRPGQGRSGTGFGQSLQMSGVPFAAQFRIHGSRYAGGFLVKASAH